MAEARGLRDVNPKAGTFVLLALLVGAAGVFLAGRAQGWFEPTLRVQTLPISLSADSTLGLQNGAEVQVLGDTVGSVVDVGVYEQGEPGGPQLKLQFTMAVRGPMLKLVRKDSQVLIKKKFGVAGSAFVQITPGRGEPAGPETRLACHIAPDLMTVVEETLNNFNKPQSPLQRSLANVETLTTNLATGKGAAGRLLSDEPTGRSLQVTLANLEKLSTNLASGQGAAGKLMSDHKTDEETTALIANARQAMESISKMLARTEGADLNGILDQLRQTLVQVEAALKEVTLTTAGLREQAKDLPGVIAETQEMMRQTTRMIEAAQKTWLLRDHVAADESPRLTPADAGQ